MPMIPDIPIVCCGAATSAMMLPDGEILSPAPGKDVATPGLIVCHAPFTQNRLNSKTRPAFDVLELFAFLYPAQFITPTPSGLARFFGHSTPQDCEEACMSVRESLQTIAEYLANLAEGEQKTELTEMALALYRGGKGWAWSSFILLNLGLSQQEIEEKSLSLRPASIFKPWIGLQEWSQDKASSHPTPYPVSAEDALQNLQTLMNTRQSHNLSAEQRPQQASFTAKSSAIFGERKPEQPPHLVMAEAGTGTGKTLGYLAPAQLWAERNEAPVWIATYTRNLQRQLKSELATVYPDPTHRKRSSVIRKGRENYLCLANLEQLIKQSATQATIEPMLGAAIMSRWASHTDDGDLTGDSFPGWLASLLGFDNTTALADSRGECLHAACDFYSKCFIEHSTRKAGKAQIVIANHALVMNQTALASYSPDTEETPLPSRYIFDEGHHLFEAADSAFSAALTGLELAELRRWLRGNEDDGAQKTRKISSRRRGLKKRLEGLLTDDTQDADNMLNEILRLSLGLPMNGWQKRVLSSQPHGPCEEFLVTLHAMINRQLGSDSGAFYSQETALLQLAENEKETAIRLEQTFRKLYGHMTNLSKWLGDSAKEDDPPDRETTRKRSISATLLRRADSLVMPWIQMLKTLINGKDAHQDDQIVDWLEITRADGQFLDVGMHRHFVDPVKYFGQSLKNFADGVLVTSATLRDSTNDNDQAELDWSRAEQKSGLTAISETITDRLSVPSPFNYAEQSKIILVEGMNNNDTKALAHAYATLFKASGGGALGIFTAIQRLKNVYPLLEKELHQAGIELLAQHKDGVDIGTLIDIFREDINACLLGTDAVRDGVDIPGNSLRLIAFDRVPWPRPTLLHNARKREYGGRAYDEELTRLKLKQAFGRLIRTENDKGVFVMLDSRLPSRLHNAFPSECQIMKMPLEEAAETVQSFLT